MAFFLYVSLSLSPPPASPSVCLPSSLCEWQVLLWATVILVIVGGIILLGYNLLPPGSFSRAWQGDDMPAGGDEEEGKWTRANYAAPNQGINYGAQAQQMRQVP